MSSQDDRVYRQIKRANERFYRAFESLDIDQMSRVWVHAERTTCVHPGWELLQGWDAVCQSWEAIFTNTDYMRFRITDITVHIYEQVAWVTCTENLRDIPETSHTTRILATNVYENTNDDWLIVHHHASPIIRPMPTLEEFGPEHLN